MDRQGAATMAYGNGGSNYMAGTQVAACSNAPQPPRGIESVIVENHKRAELILTVVEKLEERLSSALRPIPPDSEGAAGTSPRPPSSMIVEQLDRQALGLDFIRFRLERLIERIEL